MPLPGTISALLQGNLGAGLFELLLDLLGLFLGSAFLHRLRCAFHQVLRLLQAKAGQLASRVDVAGALRARTFAEYDRALTAPLHGFADERDYWARSSSRSFLARIRRPCLLLNAENDPFIPATSLPRSEVAGSPWLRAEFVSQGATPGSSRDRGAAARD